VSAPVVVSLVVALEVVSVVPVPVSVVPVVVVVSVVPVVVPAVVPVAVEVSVVPVLVVVVLPVPGALVVVPLEPLAVGDVLPTPLAVDVSLVSPLSEQAMRARGQAQSAIWSRRRRIECSPLWMKGGERAYLSRHLRCTCCPEPFRYPLKR
jgi:hypothetical protein